MVKLTGKFKRKSAENYDEFLAKVGVGFMLRKAATVSTPVMEIQVQRKNWVTVGFNGRLIKEFLFQEMAE